MNDASSDECSIEKHIFTQMTFLINRHSHLATLSVRGTDVFEERCRGDAEGKQGMGALFSPDS